jgi:hypothetical protein
MNIVEFMKMTFMPATKLSQGFERDFFYDAVFLSDMAKQIPEVLRAKNGGSYIYFEKITPGAIALARAMGFKPQLHKSYRYFPPRYVYRARVSRALPKSALRVVNELSALEPKDFEECKKKADYIK